MIDDTAAAGRAAAVSGMATRQQDGSPASGETERKSAFRQVLDEIRDKGFRAYAEDLQAAKLEEMRKEILEAMGLSEDDLAAMSPENRATIEAMVDMKVRDQLSAQTLMEKGDDAEAIASGSLDAQLQALPNGLGTGMLMLQAQELAADRNGETG